HWTSQMDRAGRALNQVHLSLRGVYPERTQAMGELFRISSHISLGQREPELLEQLESVVPDILEYERSARTYLLRERGDSMRDQVGRAIRMLSDADAPDIAETLELLSILRFGVETGLITELSFSMVDDLFFLIQPAHLQKLVGSELDSANRAIERAGILRERLQRKSL
ncbi:MAG: ATP--guanido phosphotransferase, partial [Planctomycetia bacterium]|nr:ATP--guanido phosphotransferase [Planctomycetia bacterium]